MSPNETHLYMRGFRAGEAVAKRDAEDDQRRAIDRALLVGMAFGCCVGVTGVLYAAPLCDWLLRTFHFGA